MSSISKNISLKTADILFEIKAIYANIKKPFKLTSGRLSPVYIDCRKIISFHKQRKKIIDLAIKTIRKKINISSLDYVAGGETAGIPFASWIADGLSLPMLYVRKKPKGFGRMSQIEGDMPKGSRVLLIEDLATDGKSKVMFCKTLRKAGAKINHAFVIFHYRIFKEGGGKLKKEKIKLHSLSNWHDAISVAKKKNYFDDRTIFEIERFLTNPQSWKIKK